MLYLITHAEKTDKKIYERAIKLSGLKGKVVIIPYAVEFERGEEESILYPKFNKVLDSSKNNRMRKGLSRTIAICTYDADIDLSEFWKIFDVIKYKKYSIISQGFSEEAYAVITNDVITGEKTISIKEPGEIIEKVILEEPIINIKKYCGMIIVYTEKAVYNLL